MKHLFTAKFNNLKMLVLLMVALCGRLPVAAQATCGTIDPAGNASQPGLYAEYYAGYWYGSASNDADRSAFFTTRTPALRRVETSLAVNFATNSSWGDLYNSGAGPATGGTAANPDYFSARYRGGITVPTAGTYTFYLTTDDAGYLWVDGDAKLQNPALANAAIKVTSVGTEVASAAMPLTAGFHNLVIMYGENAGDNYLVLKYTGPGVTTKTVVPSSWFCTGIRSVPTTLAYSPATQQASATVSTSSVAPTVNNGNSPVTTYAIANASSLPAGITINAATGVLTAAPAATPGSYAISVSATNDAGTATFANAYTFSVFAPDCTGIDPYGNASQPGLLAEYYPGYFADALGYFTNNAAQPLNSTGNAARIQRVEGAPNYTLSTDWSTSGLNLYTAGVATGSDVVPATFSSRYRGRLYIATAGDYTFYLSSDDASYLAIDGSATAQVPSAPFAVNNGGGHSTVTVAATVTGLTVGWHNLVLLYGNNPSNSYLKLEYASTAGLGITRQVIPNNVLCTGIVSVPTGLAYAPATTTFATGGSGVSSVPTVYTGNTGPVTFALANAGSLPAGITLNTTTGVLTANATVALGSYAVSVSATNANGTATFAGVYTFQVLAPNCQGADGGGSPAQAGLYGEYYAGYFGNSTGADTDAHLSFFTTNAPKTSLLTSVVNFVANNSWTINALNLVTLNIALTNNAQPTNFSARYRGKLYIGMAGNYTFYLGSDDASYLFLDTPATTAPLSIASATINNGGEHSVVTKTAIVYLTSGLHDVQLLYGQDTGNSYLKLEYAGPAGSGITQQTIPATAFCSAVRGSQPLPVVLTRFEAKAAGQVVAVSWATASEQNSAWFEVERSLDGVVFTKIGQVAAAGTTAQGHQYQLLDRAPLAGVSYYRLRQVDLDNSAHYSPVATVQLAAQATAPLLTLAPNPTTGRVTVQLVQATAQAATLQVLDALGREVHQLQLPAAATQEQTLDLQTLPAGVYLVRVASASGVATQRLVRE